MNIPPAGNENRLDVERSHHGSRASKRYTQVVFRTGAQATMVKNALTEELASVAHLKKSLDVEANTCYTDKKAGDKPPQPVVAVFLQCWIISLFRKIINGEVAIIRSQVG